MFYLPPNRRIKAFSGFSSALSKASFQRPNENKLEGPWRFILKENTAAAGSGRGGKTGGIWNKDQKSVRSNSPLSAASPADAAWEENDGAYIIADPFLSRVRRIEYITRPDRANNRFFFFCLCQSGLFSADHASGLEEIKPRFVVQLLGSDLWPLDQADCTHTPSARTGDLQVNKWLLRCSLFNINSNWA